MTISEQIRALRTARGWTQTQLAERCGWAQWHVSRLERGTEARPRLDTLETVARALGATLVINPGYDTAIIEKPRGIEGRDPSVIAKTPETLIGCDSDVIAMTSE